MLNVNFAPFVPDRLRVICTGKEHRATVWALELSLHVTRMCEPAGEFLGFCFCSPKVILGLPYLFFGGRLVGCDELSFIFENFHAAGEALRQDVGCLCLRFGELVF